MHWYIHNCKFNLPCFFSYLQTLPACCSADQPWLWVTKPVPETSIRSIHTSAWRSQKSHWKLHTNMVGSPRLPKPSSVYWKFGSLFIWPFWKATDSCLSEPNMASFSYRTKHGFKLTKTFQFWNWYARDRQFTLYTAYLQSTDVRTHREMSMSKHACTLFPPDNLLEAWVLNAEPTYLLSLQLTTRLKTVICVHRTAHKT